MSTPPPYYPPPSPAPPNSGGCLKAAGITCAVLIVLGALLVFFGVRSAKTAFEHGGGVLGIVGKAVRTTQSGQRLRQAVVRYRAQNGHYPAALTSLVADGAIDGKDLHSDLDPDPNPGHVSWVYARPPEDAPGKTPILTLHYHITIPGANARQSQDSDIVIDLDGTTSSDSALRSPAP